ncbi:MAG TPA: FkbM family methyltransferase [Candidatus Hodarchaeales archaeon]|nr:FkbM family methyltransferase [Candidatus Hodarchaeales archaeon]
MISKEEILGRLLEAFKLRPVIVDIGSSGGGQFIFQTIARHSMIIGFDPDARGQDVHFAKGFKEQILVPKAVVSDQQANDVTFILTRHSSCSSTLSPNWESVQNFVFRDYFDPINTVKVPATTLNKVAEEYGIEAFDWIKVDSQGTDLRILCSLKPKLQDRLMAVDVEPGLLDFYVGEDTFTSTHDFLVSHAFWMSDLQHQDYVYMTPETQKWASKLTGKEEVETFLGKSPICIEGRYMRTIAHLNKVGIRERRLAFVFALLNNKVGYAFEILRQFQGLIGEPPLEKLCMDSAYALLNIPSPESKSIVTRTKRRIIRKVKQMVNRMDI